MNETLKNYLEQEIIPRYDAFDKGHRRDHAISVMSQAADLCKYYDVDQEMIAAAAAFHDTGLCVCRETHHLESGRIVREDSQLPRWFTPQQIEIIAQAAEDHRASSDHEPRSIYGKIIAEADRHIDAMTVIRRTVQYGLSHYPELDKEGQWNRTLEHLHHKYAEGGYLKLWIPESPNAQRLEELRSIIRNDTQLRHIFNRIFTKENLSVRMADADDIHLIASLADISFRDTYKDILSPGQLEYMMEWMYSEKSLKEQISGGHQYFLAFLNDVPVAYLSVERQGERLFHLQKIYVLPQYKGQGIGAVLFEKAKEYALSKSPEGCTVELNVNRNNPAYDFYMKMGMRKVREGDFPIGGGFFMNDYIMAIDLSGSLSH